MGAATALPVRELQVEPGQTTTAKLLVRNTGQVVDQYTIDVVGESAEWTTIDPQVVNLLPGADVEVTVTFAPARAPHVAAGVVPFGLRVLSREDPPGSTVAEGTIDVAPFDDLQVELVPRQSRGRRRARHQVAIDNNGNQPATVEVSAQDEEEALDFKFDHRMASIEPGAAAFIKMWAKPEKRFLKGADRQHPFIVTVTPRTTPPIASRGTMTQRQLLPSWLIPVVAAAAVLALVAFVLYQTLVKDQIKATAQDVASKMAGSMISSANSSANAALSSAQAAASAAQAQASAANSQASAANSKASDAQDKASKAAKHNGNNVNSSPTGGTVSGVSVDNGKATSFTLTGNKVATPGNPNSFGITDGPSIGPKQFLVITALIMQNPDGDSGTMEIKRGTDPLLIEGMQNFRDQDFHFDDEPLIFTNSAPLSLAVNCQKPGAPATTCQPSILFTGRMVDKPASPSPTATP
jgi:biotin carboxyl carrier protein